MKKKGRKAFWRNIKFKYKLTVINENTLEEVIGIHVSKLNGFGAAGCLYGNLSFGCHHYCVYSLTELLAGIYEQ